MDQLISTLYTKQINLGRSEDSILSKIYPKIPIATLVTVIFVILWGAFVRITHSGAGCGKHWPLCRGEIVVLSPSIDTLIEYTHRITSGLSLILVITCYLLARKFPKNSLIRLSAWLSLIFIFTEAGIGAGLVLFGWVKENSSSTRALVVALHLINSLALIFSLVLHVFSTSQNNLLTYKFKTLISALKEHQLLIILFAIVASTGAITALGDTLFPSTSLISGIIEDFSKESHFLIKLRILHPLFALIFAYLLFNFFLKYSIRYKKLCYISAATVLIQIILGFLNIILLAPSSLQLLHLFSSIILWIEFCWIIFYLELYI